MPIDRPLLALVAFVLSSGPAFALDWPDRIWNPKPDAADEILPLPCGGKLALRRVYTSAVAPEAPEAPLMDSPVLVGATEGSRSYLEYRREDHIAGALNGDAGSYFLIGKYEVSHAQFAAVMADDEAGCPTGFGPPDALPHVELSWYDAIEFTRRLNGWLYRDQIAQLSALGIDDGYVRLPTETEWEFAVRGGNALPEAERANSRFFSTGSIDQFAWYNGAQSSGGRVRPIGQKEPNPVGLHDVYGNVEEITFDPFRMTRLDRLHGRVGGYVVRGGSFLDGPETLTSARRDEIPFFSLAAQGEVRRRSVGMRVLVSTAAIGGIEDVERIETAFQALTTQVASTAQAQPTERLEEIEARIEGPLRAEIAALRAELSAEFARRNDLADRSLRRELFNAGLAGRELLLAARAMDRHQENLADPYFPEDLKQRTRDVVEREMANFRMFSTVYTDAVAQIATDLGARAPEQAQLLVRELQAQGRGDLAPDIERASLQIEDYRSGRTTQTATIIRALVGERPWLRQD